MRTQLLGRSGLHVTPLVLGTMMFGAWGNRDHDDCVRIIHAALDAGINTLDAADVYAFGETEEIVGKAIKGRRDDIVLATKFCEPVGPGPVNRSGGSRRWIVRAVEDSLRRLGTDYIDVYQMHRPDPDTDIDETLSALSDLVRSGKVRTIGSSNFPAGDLVEAQWVSDRRGHERFRSEQLSYSIFDRHAEYDALPVAERYGLGVLVWSPLNGGWLTGKYRPGSEPPEGSRAATNADHFDFRADDARAAKLARIEALEAIARDAKLTLIELALGFVIAHRAVTAAIIGPRTMEQLESQITAADVVLDHEILDRIDEVVAPGVNLHQTGAGDRPRALTESAYRRR
ncbi:aldo/keto reductase [Cryptosporangium phraense]|uniref:aldo/keto reductase n=1 Tax=Cryptosporangium phraense TaxID=2593070 RepID=UPI001478EDA7|nr:aldo/keto reductase [Cryptosporangium phraense]